MEDLEYKNVEEVAGLKHILETGTLTLLNVTLLYSILKTRQLHMGLIKQIQDKHSFKIINKEHAYMKRIIERYFDIEDMGSTPFNISCKVTRKNVIA